ncbi:hypothetical protein [Cellulomonas soli]
MTTIVLSLAVGSALTALVVSRDPAPAALPRLDVHRLAPAPTELPHTWTVAPAGGCDGYSVAAPIADPGTPDGSTSVSVELPGTASGVTVNLVCLGPIDDLGTARELVATSTSDPRARVVETTTSPFGSALRTESTMGSMVLTEWWADHGGMVWGVGLLHRPADQDSVRTVEAMLASWQWA